MLHLGDLTTCHSSYECAHGPRYLPWSVCLPRHVQRFQLFSLNPRFLSYCSGPCSLAGKTPLQRLFVHVLVGIRKLADLGGSIRPISVYRCPRRALTLRPQLCIGIQSGARFPAWSADALSAALYGHFTPAIYRNRPISTARIGIGRSDFDDTTSISNPILTSIPRGLTLVSRVKRHSVQ